jgi:hypothetical protein
MFLSFLQKVLTQITKFAIMNLLTTVIIIIDSFYIDKKI